MESSKQRALEKELADQNPEALVVFRAALNYSHYEASKAVVRQMIDILREEPYCDRHQLAGRLGVSRQTVYNWIEALKANVKVRPRGRSRLLALGPGASVAVCIRVPCELAEKIEQRKLKATIEEMVIEASVQRGYIDKHRANGILEGGG